MSRRRTSRRERESRRDGSPGRDDASGRRSRTPERRSKATHVPSTKPTTAKPTATTTTNRINGQQKSAPTFLTKKQRQALALERLKQRRAASLQPTVLETPTATGTSSSGVRGGLQSGANPGSFAAVSRTAIPKSSVLARLIGRNSTRQHAAGSSSRGHSNTSSMTDEPDPQSEASQLLLERARRRYLGLKERKVAPPRKREGKTARRFVMEWDRSEDTTDRARTLESSAVLGARAPALMFGRGFRAGEDVGVQMKSNAFYTNLIRSRAQKGSENTEHKRKRMQRMSLEASTHWSDKPLVKMTERDWRIFCEDFNIATRGSHVPRPLRTWQEATALPAAVFKTLKRIGYKEPTPIQRQALPIGLLGLDCIGIAETGSGKTCAFLLPILTHISKLPRITQNNAGDGPYALVLAPTRELALQITEEGKKFAGDLGLRMASIVGGHSIGDQAATVAQGVDLIVATPGRLWDSINTARSIVLNRCRFLVMDEADRMIDMNYEEDLNNILDSLPEAPPKPEHVRDYDSKADYRQCLMFSATMPKKVEALAARFLQHPVYIAIGDRSGKTASTVEQRVVWVDKGKKDAKLLQVLKYSAPPKAGQSGKQVVSTSTRVCSNLGSTIVFCNAKKQCDVVVRFLQDQKFRAAVIHGGKQQAKREEALQSFKDGLVDVLVATDVMGRGIDVRGVQHVVNYDLPDNVEKYTHRIGRTGRGGASGVATSLLTAEDERIMPGLYKALIAAKALVPKQLSQHPSVSGRGSGRPIER